MITFHTASLGEVEVLLNWAAREGWNPGLDDARAFYDADPTGFFVAKQDGTLVAGISVVNHTEAFAFLGLYLCVPECRGQGIGYGLWQHAIEHADARCVGLDGVPDQQENYKTSGFALAGQTTRYTGVLPSQATGAARIATPLDVEAVVALEGKASGVLKPTYLRAWARPAATRTTIVLDDNTGVCSALTIRECRSGYKIGPLIAGDANQTKDLLAKAAELAQGAEVSIDVPGSATGLDAMCQEMGLKPGFSTARMYRGAAIQSDQQFFAVTSLELG